MAAPRTAESWSLAVSGRRSALEREAQPPFPTNGTTETPTMQTIEALQGGARTYLVHNFGNGLDGEDRFLVERFKALLDGDIRPVQPEAPKAKRMVVSREEVEAMLPARTEIIVCTGLRTRGGRQIWGDIATGIFHDRRQKG